jgi:hypothetical protein
VARWRPVETVHLPGDELPYLEWLIHRASLRDSRLNADEYRARMTANSCAYMCAKFGSGRCSYRYPGWKCQSCKGI